MILSYLLLIFNGCHSTQIVDDKYLNLQNFYKITLPDESWKRVKTNNEDFAMQHKKNNAMFAIISHHAATRKTTLDQLYKQLFIGIKRNLILTKHYDYINNQRALHIILEGELDNCKIKISAYVIKTKNFVYDIVYWSTPDKFDTSLGDFERIIKSFEFIN